MSGAEVRAHSDRRTPDAEQVDEGVWTLPLQNRPGHMPYTFCYLVTDTEGGVHVVDPGWDLEENLDAVREAILRISPDRPDPVSAIVTHLHPDHMGLADRLRAEHGTCVVMHEREVQAQEMYAQWNRDETMVRGDLRRWGVPDHRFTEILGYALGTPRVVVPADLLVEDGDLLPIPGRRLRVLHTPGHTPGHLCLVDERRRLVFSGDQLLPRVTPGIGSAGGFPENPLDLYLRSLARLSGLDDCQSLPGHEYRYRGIAARAQAIASRHLLRTAEVEDLLDRLREPTVWQVAERLSWGRGWDSLTRHHLVAALHQTSMHLSLVRSGAHRDAFEAWGRPVVDSRPRRD